MHPLAKLMVLVALVAVAFWLLTRFRDNGRNRR
jgi:flagellar biogenesis protein FliO